MIYLVSNQRLLFDSFNIRYLTLVDSLKELSTWVNCIQFDTETDDLDPHIGNLLTMQFGNVEGTKQIVVDCTTIDPKAYKEVLENHILIGANLKFDFKWLYNYGIVPLQCWDIMIVEQLLYLGYPSGMISYSLKEIAKRRLNIDIDKTVRGEIIWRGLDERVIQYAASDVEHIYKILLSQREDCIKKECLVGAKLECDAVPSIAYCEWCGIKLDADKWKAKMKNDSEHLRKSTDALNCFVFTNPLLDKYVTRDLQGDLFAEEAFDLSPKCKINWSSSKQVVEVAKILGFNTTVQDKKTGEDKDSVLEKTLKVQKGINDEFLKLYFDYQEAAKVCSTYGQAQLNMINPNTGRCHTEYHQLGASSGRMSCGSRKPNKSLAKLNGVPPSECTYAK